MFDKKIKMFFYEKFMLSFIALKLVLSFVKKNK